MSKQQYLNFKSDRPMGVRKITVQGLDSEQSAEQITVRTSQTVPQFKPDRQTRAVFYSQLVATKAQATAPNRVRRNRSVPEKSIHNLKVTMDDIMPRPFVMPEYRTPSRYDQLRSRLSKATHRAVDTKVIPTIQTVLKKNR